MRIDYSISLWNFYHYSGQPSLERVVDRVRQAGYGIEFWGSWGDEPNLYDAVGRRRLAAMSEGMRVSLHTAGANNRETMTNHIETAAAVGAKVIVLHPWDLAMPEDPKTPNLDHARWAVETAAGKGVTLALENGEYEFLCRTVNAVEGLRFCFDVGHPYYGGGNAGDFLSALSGRLVHLHLQDFLPEAEKAVPGGAFGDHYILGTGSIPQAHWQKLADTLKRIDFTGTGVFEIHPRDPVHTAFLGQGFMKNILG